MVEPEGCFQRSVHANPSVIGILLTSKCNIACRHCCNESGPGHAGSVEFSSIARAIDEATHIPSVRQIGFSGGEPFLFLDLLHRAVEYAGSRGYSSSVTTNGFWGQSRAIDGHLRTLRDAGLTSLCISTSAFHQEFLSSARLSAAVALALDAGLAVTVNIVGSATFGRPSVERSLGELADRVEVVVMPLLPSGRAATQAGIEEFEGAVAAPMGNCRHHFSKLAIDRRGDAYPCCSPGGFTDPLRLGNVYRDGLSAVLESAGQSRLLAILEEVGPAYFLPFLRASGMALPETFSDQCHLCHFMLSDEAMNKVVSRATDQLFEELEGLNAMTEDRPGEEMSHGKPQN